MREGMARNWSFPPPRLVGSQWCSRAEVSRRHCAVPSGSQVDSPLTAVTERVNARQLWRHDSANQLWLWVICSTVNKAFNRVLRNVSLTVKQCHKVNTVECLGKVEKNTSRVLSVLQSLYNHIDKWHNCLSITFSEMGYKKVDCLSITFLKTVS